MLFASRIYKRLTYTYKQINRIRNYSSEKNQSIKYDLKTKVQETAAKEINPRSQLPLNIRFYTFWATAAGQKVSGFLLISGSILSAVYQIAPHTVLIKFVRDYYQNLTYGIPTPVSTEMSEVLNEVVNDLKMSSDEVERLKMFVMSVMDSRGWGELSNSSIVGYPFYFEFKDPQEVPLRSMQFGHRGSGYAKHLSEEELHSKEAQLLVDGLLLSKDAKKFAIAREIEKVKMMPQYQLALAHSSMVLLALLTSRMINQKMDLFRKPPMFRGVGYSTVLITISSLYFLVKDTLNRRVQSTIDENTARLSDSYARGGIEYYTKIMQRNIALRELALDGKKLYNMKGEEVYEYIRLRNKPFGERKQICETVLKNFNSEV